MDQMKFFFMRKKLIDEVNIRRINWKSVWLIDCNRGEKKKNVKKRKSKIYSNCLVYPYRVIAIAITTTMYTKPEQTKYADSILSLSREYYNR